MLQLIQDYSEDNGSADIDISGAEFNFVRSIRVFHVRASQWESNSDDSDCYRYDSVKLGTYGVQGDYGWTDSERPGPTRRPCRAGTLRASSCPSVSNRSVFIEWRDYQGNYGYEQVNY